MNIFSNSTFTWWQVGVLKLCLITFGMVIGAYWEPIVAGYLMPLLVISVISGAYITYVYFKQH